MPKVAEVTKSIERLLAQIELSTGQKPASEYRRVPWRYRWVTPATVEVVDSKGPAELLYITTRSISTEGLDFRSSRILELGCKVLITLETDEGQIQIPAIVKHSTESVGMPIVGVAFDPQDELPQYPPATG